MSAYKKIFLLVDKSPKAKKSAKELREQYDFHDDIETADVVVVLGGDGFMLHSLHKMMNKNVPLYGINRGTYGFLLNKAKKIDLIKRINNASKTVLYPLKMTANTTDNKTYSELAVNEVSMLRQTYQAANLNIKIDNEEHLADLVCDGVIVATPAGSSAYNLSANGPVIPLSAELLALTPLSPFRPRRWRGALLPSNKTISIEVKNPQKRPVSTVADFAEIRDVQYVEVKQQNNIKMQLLFDPDHKLEDKLIKEQFVL